MALKDRLYQDMVAAMKAREEGKTRLSVLRLARAAVVNAEKQTGRELDDAGVVEVLAREVKKRRESAEEYRNLGKGDTAAALEEEIRILMDYLPEQLSEAQLRELVEKTVEKLGASSERDLGRVMGAIMPQVKGKADGRLVNAIALEVLKQKSP